MFNFMTNLRFSAHRIVSPRYWLVTLSLGLSGCAFTEHLVDIPVQPQNAEVRNFDLSMHQRSMHTFDPVDLKFKVDQQRYLTKTDNLIIVVDHPSDSSLEFMGESERRRYSIEITRRLLRTLPESSYSVRVLFATGLFDNGDHQFSIDDALRTLELQPINPTMGPAPLSEIVAQITESVVQLNGNSSVVLVTDWDRIDQDAVDSVMRLFQRFKAPSGFVVKSGNEHWHGGSGDSSICLYTIGVGNRMSRSLLDSLDYCGGSFAADKVAQPRDMAFLVETIMYSGPADLDSDGIYDYLDRCPSTPKGRLVNYEGCLRFQDLKGEQ